MYTLGIEAFLAIIENGSISKASEILHLSQSTVSHRLKNLEKELGFDLLVRRPGIRGIGLTDRGRAFVTTAQKSLLLNKEIERIRHLNLKTPLTIGSADSISQYVLPSFYKALLQDFSGLQPRIITQHTLESYESIKTGQIDIGFVKREFNMPNVLVKKLIDEEMVLVRFGHDVTRKAYVDPNELCVDDEIFMDWGYSYQIWHDRHWKDRHYRIQVDAAQVIFKLFENEKQWSIVPRSIYKSMADTGPFFEQKLTQPPPNRTCYLIKHKYVQSEKQSIIDYIEKYFEDQFKEG